ncbi:response regulator [Clostridium vincentii]|uniref:Stage 0 sporulation protein A homolog n=1 Tax=Clostridium vincentii TaxID=52704 RepID=A0A2T0BAB5_9CLOT|nr:response regulator [Clostridium vincentii]PRR80782.1 Hydrogenase transcriptional regulatory protein hupR1 [Clostridium vincentii]
MNNNKVLFVDDEVNILNSIRRVTIGEEFETIIATNGERALEIFSENEISVIVTDMRMPKMNGLELLEKVKEISPNTIRMVLSGYAQIPQVIATVNKVGVFKYITKPWNNEEEFLPAIAEALHYYNLQRENDLFKSQLEERNKLYKKMLEYNNAIVKNSQSDVDSIKIITKKYVTLKNNCFKSLQFEHKNNELSTYINDVIDKLYFQYLETIPSIKESFNLSVFDEKFKVLEEKGITLIFENDSIKKINYLGNKRIIVLVLDNMLNVITSNCDSGDIILNFSNSKTLNINFLIRNKTSLENMSNNIEFKLVLNILDDMCKTFGGKLSFNPEKFQISIDTNLQIQN